MSIIIVGGGLVGCAVALELARRGREVVCLERAVPGAEASSAAGGILAPRVEAHGDAEARELGLRSLALYEPWLASLEADVGFRRAGVLVARPDSPDPDARWLPGARLDHLAPGLRVPGAWWLAEEAVLDTRRLVPAVRTAAILAGVRFRAGEEVARLGVGEVDLAGGERLEGEVVVCAGAWTARIAGLEALPVRPVRGQMAALGDTGVTSTVVFGPAGYLVPRADELVVGSTMEEVGFERAVTAGGLRHVLDHAITLAPPLAQAPVLRTWSNFRPGSPDGRALVGRVPVGWVASGHFRNGILLAPLTARLLADAMLDGAELPAAWNPARG